MIDSLLTHTVQTLAAVEPVADAIRPQPQIEGTLFGAVLSITLSILVLALLLTSIRLIKGETLADRVVSIDQIANFIVGIIAVYAVQTQNPEIISVSIVMALILFVGTAAFALYMEKGGSRQP